MYNKILVHRLFTVIRFNIMFILDKGIFVGQIIYKKFLKNIFYIKIFTQMKRGNCMFFWNKNRTSTSKKEPELALLKTVNNDYELAAIKGILDNNKIMYLINDTSLSGYLRITTGAMFGSANIVVKKSDLNKAKELIEEIFEVEEEPRKN